MLRRALCPLFVLTVALPAGAQTPPSPPDGQGPQTLRVARISPWIDDRHPFVAQIQITNTTELALENASIRVAVFGRIVSRSQLGVALDHGASTPLIGLTSDRVPGIVAPGEQRTISFTRSADELGRMSRTGVYPVEIDLRSPNGSANVTTAIVFLSGELARPINVAWVMRISRPTLRRGDGVYPSDALARLAADELTQQMNVVAAHPAIPLTFAASPSFLDTLADIADGFAVRTLASVDVRGADAPSARAATAALAAVKRAAASVGEIATVPYAPADLPSLARHGLRADLLHQVTLGRSVAESRLGRAPSLSAFFAGERIDEDGLTALRPLGVSGIVASPRTLSAQPSEPFQPYNFGISRPVSLDLSGSTDMPALLADPDLSQRGSSQEQGVLAGQALVAMTAIAWLEIPAFAAERVIVIAPEVIMGPPALGAMIDGLSGAPWVHLRTVTDTFGSLQARSSTQLAAPQPQDTPYLAGARAARRALTTLAKIVSTPPPELEEMDRYVLLAESDEWRDAPGTGAAIAREVVDRVRGVTRAVHVVPRQVTLTSRRGSVPVTVVNENGFALNVRVRLESPKVSFPSGASRTVDLQPPNQTIDFAIEARATGAFPIDVRVESPDGRNVLASGRLVIRSTAVSAVALTAVAGGAAFLVLGSLRRGRRRKTAGSR